VAYEVTFLEIAGPEEKEGPKAFVVFGFEILDGPRKTRADVILTYTGVEIIEQGGKDPKSAASIALQRLLREGRDPFESQISLQIPYGHAEHFSRYENFDSLPVLDGCRRSREALGAVSGKSHEEGAKPRRKSTLWPELLMCVKV
jgi:hypothetical protein